MGLALPYAAMAANAQGSSDSPPNPPPERQVDVVAQGSGVGSVHHGRALRNVRLRALLKPLKLGCPSCRYGGCTLDCH
jgi:hypothetical protein